MAEVHLSHQTHLIGTTDPTLPRKNDDNHDGDDDRDNVNINDRLKISSPHSVGILKKRCTGLVKMPSGKVLDNMGPFKK